MRQPKFCPDKQQYNNAKPFPVYVLEIEEVENYYKCFKYEEWCSEPGIAMYLMLSHQNDSFALFGKFCLKTGMHMNFYFIAAS